MSRCELSRKKRLAAVCHAVIAIAAIVLIGCGVDYSDGSGAGQPFLAGDYVEYEGEKFRLSKQYSDYDEFKEDPHNYLASETERMQAAVRKVKFRQSAPDLETLVKESLQKQFPGFGCGQLGQLDRNQPFSCYAFFIAIPRSQLNRYAGYAKKDGRFELVADFVAPEMPMIAMVAVKDGDLVFYGMDRSELKRVPIQKVK